MSGKYTIYLRNLASYWAKEPYHWLGRIEPASPRLKDKFKILFLFIARIILPIIMLGGYSAFIYWVACETTVSRALIEGVLPIIVFYLKCKECEIAWYDCIYVLIWWLAALPVLLIKAAYSIVKLAYRALTGVARFLSRLSYRGI